MFTERENEDTPIRAVLFHVVKVLQLEDVNE